MPAFSLTFVAFSLIAVALILLGVELFLPTHGILSAVAALVAIAGVVVGYMAAPALGVLLGIIVVIAAPFAVFWAIRLYPKTPFGKRVMLGRPDPQHTRPQNQDFADLVGKRGVALTRLRPAGLAEIDGRRIDCLSDSELIQPGTPVEVVRVAGRKVTVQRVV